jgi:enoyl-CoA hydratase/carnithine racemase
VPSAALPAGQDQHVAEPWAPEVSTSGDVTGAVHVLDLDAGVGDVDALVADLSARTAVVVGAARGPVDERLAAALDLTLTEQPAASRHCVQVADVASAVRRIEQVAVAQPRAVLVLGALLRQTALLPAAEGLAAEASAYSTLLAGPEFARWLAARGPARPAHPDDQPRVDVRREGDLLEVRLVRVVRRNAFDAAMRVALSDALAVARADDAVQVRLTGAGPVFSAGGDLDEFGRAADPATAWVVRVGDSPALALALLSERTQAVVQGACVGAGVELPAFAGRVVADPATTFRLPEVAMGLLPGAGGTVSLTQRIGRWRTLWLALSGDPIDVRTALDWGLVDEVAAVAP